MVAEIVQEEEADLTPSHGHRKIPTENVLKTSRKEYPPEEKETQQDEGRGEVVGRQRCSVIKTTPPKGRPTNRIITTTAVIHPREQAPTLRSPAQGSCTRKMSPQDAGL